MKVFLELNRFRDRIRRDGVQGSLRTGVLRTEMTWEFSASGSDDTFRDKGPSRICRDGLRAGTNGELES